MATGLLIEPAIRISATQIDVIERCERLWYYDRVLGLRDKTPSKSQGIGIRVEDMIAAKLFENKDPPAGKEGNIARAMLAKLPPTGDGLVSQQEFSFPVPIGDGLQTALVVGKKDLVRPGVEVFDYKTTKSLSKWQKTPAQLLADIQPQTYALDEFYKHGLDPVPMIWVYGQTEGAQRADVTRVVMARETFQKGFDRAVRAATLMVELKATKPKAEDVKPNIRACDMFGGCPHRAYCPARVSKLSDFLPKEEGTMGLKDKLKASLGITTEAKPAAEEAPTAATEGQKAALGSAKAAEIEKVNETFKAAMGGQVNPHDAAPSPDDQIKTTEAASPAVEEPKAKRGRKPKAETEAAAPAAPAGPVKTVLLIDSVVVKGVGTPLESLLRRAAEAAAEKADVPDWRLVDYGKGAGLLLVSFAELWAQNPPSGLLTINMREPEAVTVLAWLTDKVDLVVRGVA